MIILTYDPKVLAVLSIHGLWHFRFPYDNFSRSGMDVVNYFFKATLVKSTIFFVRVALVHLNFFRCEIIGCFVKYTFRVDSRHWICVTVFSSTALPVPQTTKAYMSSTFNSVKILKAIARLSYLCCRCMVTVE